MSPAEALDLAGRLHAGQLDKAGQPYIGHLRRVAAAVYARGGSDAEQIAAALHDAIEDGHATAEFLAADGVPSAALHLVALLTKAEGQRYADYLAAIKADPGALLVKLADIADNSDPERLAMLPPDVADRLRTKYSKAMEILA
jgi:(p)ppGpp synthase/HD superfamily hydrolase